MNRNVMLGALIIPNDRDVFHLVRPIFTSLSISLFPFVSDSASLSFEIGQESWNKLNKSRDINLVFINLSWSNTHSK